MKAVYPGTFDIVTKGHLDIIERASAIFDEVAVLIMANPRKECVFTPSERKAMLEKCIAPLVNHKKISVVIGSGLTVDMAAKTGSGVIVRGIRAVSDYEYELVQATANMALNDKIETMLLIAKPEYSFLSSSAVKEIAENGGDISGMTPAVIVDDVMKKLTGSNVGLLKKL